MAGTGRSGLAAMIALLWACTTAVGAVGSWSPLPLEGGDVRTIAHGPSDGTRAYAGTTGGPFHSADGGATWQRGGGPAARLSIETIAVHPTDPQIAVASTALGVSPRMIRTEDGGTTWVAAETGLLPTGIQAIEAVAFDPSQPGRVYTETPGGVRVSDDSGATWTTLVSRPPGRVRALAANPAGTIIFAATSSDGVHSSKDGGAEWNATDDAVLGGNVLDLALYETTPGSPVVYAAAPTGVFRSVDSDAWTDVSGDLGTLTSAPVLAVRVDPNGAGTADDAVHVVTGDGYFRSLDGGADWSERVLLATPAAGSGGVPRAVSVRSAPSDEVLLGTSVGPLRGPAEFPGSGAPPVPATTGVDARSVEALALTPGLPGELLAGTDAGVHASANLGAQWARLDVSAAEPAIGLLGRTGAVPSTVWAASPPFLAPRGVFRSTDAGADWTDITAGVGGTSITGLAVHPVDPLTAYVATLGGSGVQRTDDGGATWDEANGLLPSVSVTALALDPTTPTRLYAFVSGGLWVTNNAGATWAAAGAGLDAANVRLLVAHPTEAGTVYAAGAGRELFRSTDAALTWQQVGEGVPAGSAAELIHAIAFDPVDPTTMYLASSAGVQLSTDGGILFTQFSTGLDPSVSIRSLAVAATTPRVVYAGTDRGGLLSHTIPPDADGDGVPDATDACPGVAATTPDGCPPVAPPPDTDGDGIADAGDQCPAVAGPAPTGCPVVAPVAPGPATPGPGTPGPAGPAPGPAEMAPRAVAPLPRALRLGRPVVRRSLVGARLRLVVRATLPAAARGRAAVIQRRVGARWVAMARLRVPANRRVVRTITLPRARLGAARRVQVRILLPATRTARAAQSPPRTVPLPALSRRVGTTTSGR